MKMLNFLWIFSLILKRLSYLKENGFSTSCAFIIKFNFRTHLIIKIVIKNINFYLYNFKKWYIKKYNHPIF